ncbi:choline transport [Fusarium longipes]|uniref:Choline transport n=1 Tax=Fusarium longipes TaxID=694270 RepID=A0A395RIG2_9HYPO|nr:choline transport [Fusarium longipes]
MDFTSNKEPSAADKPTETTSSGLDLESAIESQRQDKQPGQNPNVEKNFSLISLAGIGVVVGNVWPALGGSLQTSIYNGGAPGVIYEYVASSICYFTVATVIAELSSALPSSAGVHLWASITPGRKHGKIVGYLAGYWNCFAWIFAVASITCISLCFGNRIIPLLNIAGLLVILLGATTTIVICATMVNTQDDNPGPASNHDVWVAWEANIGYPDGFVFVAGMLNSAFAMGTPDAAVHLAEEIPNPGKNVPKAIAAQGLLPSDWAFVSYCKRSARIDLAADNSLYLEPVCHVWSDLVDSCSSQRNALFKAPRPYQLQAAHALGEHPSHYCPRDPSGADLPREQHGIQRLRGEFHLVLQLLLCCRAAAASLQPRPAAV